MPALFLCEEDISQLIEMPEVIEVVEASFRSLAHGVAENVPRKRLRVPGLMLHSLLASDQSLGTVGWKIYTTTRQGARFLVGVYDTSTGAMTGLLEANLLGQLRTGAASGVATKYLARQDATRVGLIGTGNQAWSQLKAVCSVRSIESVAVYSRDRERRTRFAEAMRDECGISVCAVDSIEEAVRDQSIVITATTSKSPLFDGGLIAPGTHLNAIGNNFLKHAELDTKAIQNADLLVCDSLEQCQQEAGDLANPVLQGLLDWDHVLELADVVVGDDRKSSRTRDSEITIFKSVGLGIQDLSLATELLKRAREQGAGQALPF